MPREWVGEWQQFRKRKLANISLLNTREYLWERQQQPIMWIRMETHQGRASFDWNLDPSLLPMSQGLLHAVGKQLQRYLTNINTTKISVETGCLAMPDLADFTQARLINRRFFYELNKHSLERASLEKKVETFRQSFPELGVHIYRNRPDEILDPYIQLYNIVAASIPRADSYAEPYQSWPAEALRRLNETNRQTANQVLTLILKDLSGKFIGLTDLNVHIPHPHRIYQGMTGIDPAYRGKGLGSWLKLAMLLHVWNAFPDFEIIDTDCNVLNHPVQRMNEGIGFVRTGEGWEYEIDFHQLKHSLESS